MSTGSPYNKYSLGCLASWQCISLIALATIYSLDMAAVSSIQPVRNESVPPLQVYYSSTCLWK